jgi:excisionase family DNA binding protein
MNEYFTVNQTASLLHVSPTTVRRWIYDGNLKARKINTGRNARVLIQKDELDKLLIPIREQKISDKTRKATVNRILDLRQQFAGRGIDVDFLIEQNRQERDRE